MGLTTVEAERIARKIQAALKARGLTAAEAARAAGVDPSRLSRILHGSFSTLNPTVVQICNFLGVTAGSAVVQDDNPARICDSALKVWNGTAEDVEAVVKLFEQLAALRRGR